MIDLVSLIVILILAFFIHELGHWIPAKYYKKNIGFIHLYKYGGFCVKVKAVTIKQGFLISVGGLILPLLISPLFLLLGFEIYVLWVLCALVLPFIDYFYMILYLCVIKEKGWFYKKVGNNFNVSLDVIWQLDKKLEVEQ